MASPVVSLTSTFRKTMSKIEKVQERDATGDAITTESRLTNYLSQKNGG
jgi:hypothetical protein